ECHPVDRADGVPRPAKAGAADLPERSAWLETTCPRRGHVDGPSSRREEVAAQAGGGTVAVQVAQLEIAHHRELVGADRRQRLLAGWPALGEEIEDDVPALALGEALLERRHRRLHAAVGGAVEHLVRAPVVRRFEDVRRRRLHGRVDANCVAPAVCAASWSWSSSVSWYSSATCCSAATTGLQRSSSCGRRAGEHPIRASSTAAAPTGTM